MMLNPLVRRAPFRGVGLVALLALSGSACADSVGSNGPSAQLLVRPEFPSAVVPGLFDLDVDRVRIRIIRPPTELVLDTAVAFPAEANQISVRLRVPLLSRQETLVLSLEMSAEHKLLFAGSREVEVSDATTEAPAIPLQYVGPGANLSVVRIEPRDSVLKPGDRFTFNVFAFFNGLPVNEFYIGWTTGDTAVARIDAKGTITAPADRGSVMVRVISPNGVRDSTRLWFAPPPATISGVGGDNQIGYVGGQLGALLGVQVLATDGLGVPGVRVRFVPLSGGEVRDTVAITDGTGVARTTAFLGRIAGDQLFEAFIPFLPPVVFHTTATAGPPALVVPLSGNNQSGIVGQLLPNALVTSVSDAFGNPVGNVAVGWVVTSGNGALETMSLKTNQGGLASATFRLGTVPGSNVVRATVGPGLFATFTATGSAAQP
jgi:hypothetical protein